MKKVVWLLKEFETWTGQKEYSPAINWWYGGLEKLGYNVIYYAYENYDADTFYKEMKEYKPDYIFHPCYDKIHTEFENLKEFTQIYVVQSDDDWRYENFAKHYIPIVSGIISYQADRNWYIKDGLNENQIISLRWAFNPNTMLLKQPPNKRDILVSHGGSLYGDRIDKINLFKSLGMDVKVMSKVPYHQLLDLWSRTKFSLCFTKASNGNFRQKKGRIAELGYHSLLVSEPFPDIEKYFDPGSEFIIFEEISEVIDKINFLDQNPKEYNKIQSNSRKRILNDNTIFHEWAKAMSIIDPDFKPVDINKIINEFNIQ